MKIEGGQAQVIAERCIACGECIKVCSRSAQEIEHASPAVNRMLQAGEVVYACVSPAAPAAFYPASMGQLVTGLRRLGFAAVLEVAFGAELIARRYDWLLQSQAAQTVIATPCPALVAYVEKYEPGLLSCLAPIVSATVATGRLIKQRLNPGASVVFVGPCVAEKAGIEDPQVKGAVDAVLTFVELKGWLGERGINLAELPESEFDGPHPRIGGLFSIPGGLLQSIGLVRDLVRHDLIVAEGKTNCLAVLKELADGRLQARFVDILFCAGCVDGPQLESDLRLFQRREVVARYVASRQSEQTAAELESVLRAFDDLDLSRGFTSRQLAMPVPSEWEIRAILEKIDKPTKGDELNCGACGYPTCRDKAIAVYHGLAEADICLPYLIDRLAAVLQDASKLKALDQAKSRFIRLVSHELRAPLGAVQSYLAILKQGIVTSPEQQEQIIERSSRRIEGLLGLIDDLLDLAKIEAGATDRPVEPTRVAPVGRETIGLLQAQAETKGISVRDCLPDTLPPVLVNRDDLERILTNLLSNAIKYNCPGGWVTLEGAVMEGYVRLRIVDTGIGIPTAELPLIFEEFHRVKSPETEEIAGTGLGLAITKRLVEAANGRLEVESELGKGSIFSVLLPIA